MSTSVPDRILVVDQEPEAGRIAEALDRAGFGVARAGVQADLVTAIATHGIAGIVVAHRPPADDAFPVLEDLRARRVAAPIVLVAPDASTDVAVRAVKAGAHDVVE